MSCNMFFLIANTEQIKKSNFSQMLSFLRKVLIIYLLYVSEKKFCTTIIFMELYFLNDKVFKVAGDGSDPSRQTADDTGNQSRKE